MFDDIITLVSEIDEETTEENEVLATVESVGQKEFFSAAQAGLNAEYKFSVWLSDYNDETYVKYNKRTLDIYRKFIRKDGKIELYCCTKVGV